VHSKSKALESQITLSVVEQYNQMA